MNRIKCPGCGHRLKYSDEYAGKKAKCQKCGQSIRLPYPTVTAAGEPKPLAPMTHPSWMQGPGSNPTDKTHAPTSSKPRRKWLWLASGVLIVISLIGSFLWLFWPESNEPYTGPPPPVELEIKGFKVVLSAPFRGRLQIRNGTIIPPPAPDGYEFTSEHNEIILGRSHSFGWKPISGVLMLVITKVSVKEPTPRLEDIKLVQGKQEIATLDGLAQPEFEKASAKSVFRKP
jgi:hypothetical protein